MKRTSDETYEEIDEKLCKKFKLVHFEKKEELMDIDESEQMEIEEYKEEKEEYKEGQEEQEDNEDEVEESYEEIIRKYILEKRKKEKLKK